MPLFPMSPVDFARFSTVSDAQGATQESATGIRRRKSSWSAAVDMAHGLSVEECFMCHAPSLLSMSTPQPHHVRATSMPSMRVRFHPRST